MTGPPGSGKTMLASRMPGIMCPLNEAEQLEVASIRSLCGILLSTASPTCAVRGTAPHRQHGGLVGGGSGIAVPGAITRAHRGILFLDEAPEFSARALQTLREPLESGYVALSRSKGSTYYPASFQLIMAANPCPCGYYYGTGERCACREKTVYVISRDCPDRYWIVWIFRWRCHQSRALPRKASQSASPVPGYKLV